MNRRQLAFVILLNTLISVVVALAVVWAVEARRPDPEALAIQSTSNSQAVILPTPAPSTIDAIPNPSTPISVVTTAGESAATPTATVDPTTQQIYTIQAGDSLSAVAGRFGVTLDDLIKANNLTDPNFVFIGQRLVIPARGEGASGSSSNALSTQVSSDSAVPPLDIGEGMLIRTINTPGTQLTEALQIVNDSNEVVNLSGWRLEKEGGPVYTFGSLSIFPGSSIWVHTTTGTDTSIALYWNQPEAVWQSGTAASLVDPQGKAVNRYTVP
jgi:LysM repeat protein